jgi:hypothetical protein
MHFLNFSQKTSVLKELNEIWGRFPKKILDFHIQFQRFSQKGSFAYPETLATPMSWGEVVQNLEWIVEFSSEKLESGKNWTILKST